MTELATATCASQPASPNPNSNPEPDGEARHAPAAPSPEETRKRKVVVVMGATGAGKSRLAVDLAGHLDGVEVVSADSMQVYCGLDVLTNKVPLHEQNGVPHHLLGMIDPSVEFTCRDFRDLAVPIIDDILDRGGLPVIVGGTNFYIQALVSPFLFDDMTEDMLDCSLIDYRDLGDADESNGYECLKKIDPVAAQRIHPNDHRKLKRYLDLYANTGTLPSDLFQGEAAEKWGRASDSRFDCCFLWIDADLHVLDIYVDRRVDCMIDSGLLNEVCNIYDPDAVYTRGLRQAIGVREFHEFFRIYLSRKAADGMIDFSSTKLHRHDEELKSILDEAVSQLKINTRRLVRRQRRRLNRLSKDFAWNLHHIDATEAFCCTDGDLWQTSVVKPCVEIVKSFLSDNMASVCTDASNSIGNVGLASRDLWTQYVCEACDNRVLRGAHEWEQHKQGRGHRKRVQQLKKKRPSS